MTSHEKPRIGITTGDPNGIGPEILIRSLNIPELREKVFPIIFGSAKALTFHTGTESGACSFSIIKNPRQSFSGPQTVNLINCETDSFTIKPGHPTDDGALQALIALEAGIEALLKNEIDALVTGPVNKHTISRHVRGFTGQTGMLTKKAGKDDALMILIGKGLRVALATVHIPLKEVPGKLTDELLTDKLLMLNNALIKDFNTPNPRIAMLGLNPHAGEHGLIGSEEENLLKPLIEMIKRKGMGVSGPFPADGFFGAAAYEKFDGVMALYHDQGLIPFKTLAFEEGVNFTAGLPVIRTSPDHGTAYDLVGKGIASHKSIVRAIELAAEIFLNRKTVAEKNTPLQTKKSQKTMN